MPHNKRESLIFTVLMCFTMVLWMSIYNVALQHNELSLDVIVAAWIGFPIAYVFAMACDWFFVSNNAKKFAFRFLVNPESAPLKKVIAISAGMVVQMVLIMSFYGACEGCFHTGDWSQVFVMWIHNIPFNFIMALPFQMIIAGPLVRFVFRKSFPEGCISY